jgi:molybdopterin molybdotransferase
VTRYEDALAIVRASGARRAIAVEEVPLEAALGRAVAAEVRGDEAVPSFDNSGMDGFAVRAEDLAGASPARPVRLAVRASIAAGDDASRADARGGCAEIMTGAAIPPGCDAVVRVEDVEVERDARGNAAFATFRAPAERGAHVRPAGDDFRPGDVLARAGVVVAPEHVLALATLGVAAVLVRRRPRVAVVATGKEVVPYTTRTLAPGALRNSTTPYLRAVLQAFGAECASAAAIGDEPGALRGAIEAARGADLVLTTGAVSAGKHDFVRDVLASLGARVLFHKLAVRPGKPVLFAEIEGGPAVLGLPGNPVASAVSFRFLAVPFLRAALGLAPERPLRAVLGAAARKPDGLRCFFKARWVPAPAGAAVQTTGGQGSAIVSSLVAANAWAVLPEEGDRVPAGTEIDVLPLHPAGLSRSVA